MEHPTIQLIGLSRPEDHLVPGESERGLEKKVKTVVADEDVRLEADDRKRQKLARMVCLMERTQAWSTNSIQGRGLRGCLGYVVDGELETLSSLSGTTMREGEEEEREEKMRRDWRREYHGYDKGDGKGDKRGEGFKGEREENETAGPCYQYRA